MGLLLLPFVIHPLKKIPPFLSTTILTAVENEEQNQQTIPLPTVAQQVITNAENEIDSEKRLLKLLLLLKVVTMKSYRCCPKTM